MRVAPGCTAVITRGLAASVSSLLLFLTPCTLDRVAAEDTDSENQPSLSTQIDQLLLPALPEMLSPPAPDGILLRRLSLDLRGVVPTREELDAFVADQSPGRWADWVDRFLQDPLCDEHVVRFLDRTLMLRRKHTHVDRASWESYLRDHVLAETSLDGLSRELLYSPWWNKDHHAAQRFYLDRGGESHLIVRDLGRIFLGRDMQCAQCHDHPLVEDYRQVDYHGLLAFVSGGALVQASYKDADQKTKKLQLYVEKDAGDAAFESVFEVGTKLRSATRLVGQVETFDPYYRPGERYIDKAPEDALAGATVPPRVSRREQLANQLANRDNDPFVANWANRLWAMVFGRGLVHPVDMMEPDNPPSHPQLFALITNGLRSSDMKIKPFLRQLVTTDAYRRGNAADWIRLGDQPDDPRTIEFRERLNEQLAVIRAKVDSLKSMESEREATYQSARAAWLKVQADRSSIGDELDKAEAAMVAAKKKHDDAIGKLNAAKKKLSDNQSRSKLLEESAAKLSEAMALGEGKDPELSEIIELAKKRAEETRGKATALEKSVADTQAAVDKTVPALTQATSQVEEVVKRLQPIQTALLAADQAHVAARRDWSNTHGQLVATRRSLFQLERWSKWLNEKDHSRKLAQSIQTSNDKLRQSQIAETNMTAAIDATKTTIAAADEAVTVAQQAVAVARQSMVTHQETIKTLQGTLVSLGTAVELVSQNETLLAAQESLRQEIAAKQMQSAEFQRAVADAENSMANKSAALAAAKKDLETKLASLQTIKQQATELRTEIADLKSRLTTSQASIQSETQAIATDTATQLASRRLTPLSPEQLCLSTLRITGMLDAQMRRAAAELDKQTPLAEDADETAKLQRERQVVQNALEKLRGHVDRYVALYASGSDKTQDDFFASADQALYVANGGSVYSWAAPNNQNPTQVATTQEDPAEVAKTLYWSYLCRQPSESEITLVTEQLASAGDQRSVVIQEMSWSLLASAEFRFAQ